jgi:hypothetical protein
MNDEVTFPVLHPQDLPFLSSNEQVVRLTVRESPMPVSAIFCNLLSRLECYTICLQNCATSGDVLYLSNTCRNLVQLTLYDCQLTALDWDLLMSNCPRLQVLDLSFNQLSTLSYRGLNRSLEALNLRGNRYKSTPNIAGFQRLQTLNLASNFIETFFALTSTTLTDLNISGNPILLSWETFQMLTNHVKFTHLNIEDTYLYDTPSSTESHPRFRYYDNTNCLLCDKDMASNYIKLWKSNVHHLVLSEQRPRLHRDYFAKMHITVFSGQLKEQVKYVAGCDLKRLVCVCYDTNPYAAILLISVIHCYRDDKLTLANEFRNIALTVHCEQTTLRTNDLEEYEQMIRSHRKCNLI